MSTIQAQIPGRNVNVVSGLSLPDGDPFLQRQNEPSMAASTRNPLHLLGGSNDYRTVDLPGLPDDVETGDAWLGLFKSTDGGQRWTSSLLPGYAQDTSPAGIASPLRLYQAGADAVVRAGTHGLIYYSGLVFDRVDDGKSGVFLARFIDNNNKEGGDPFAYLGTTMVASSNGAKFLDKPWMAVDIPRAGAATCNVTADSIIPTAAARRGQDNQRGSRRRGGRPPVANAQHIPAGAVYVAYSSITGEGATLRSEILLARSMDCGATWSTPMRVSRAEDQINQGASIAIDPRTGAVYVGWRRFDPDLLDANDLDGIMMARLPFGGRRFDPPGRAYGFPRAQSRRVARRLDNIFEHRGKRGKGTKSKEVVDEVDQFDLGTSGLNFRTNAYPTMTADGSGRIYMAWTQRGFAAPDSAVPLQGARIVITTTRDGRTFTTPRAVDDHADPVIDPYTQLPTGDTGVGHQLMPSMTFAGGKLMLVYYDFRETRALTFNSSIKDPSSSVPTRSGKRQTIDIRSAMASPGDNPVFNGSVRVSEYLMGSTNGSPLRQLQVNPPNLPMFKQGTVPFMGDYIDVAAAPAFVPAADGQWAYNTRATGEVPVFHAVWTDNRDVRPPVGGDWTKYTPVSVSGQAPACDPGTTGSRNQNIYSSRITGGLLAGSPGNSKPLGYTTVTLPDGSTQQQLITRAFVVFAQNTSDALKSFRMTILNQPTGGRASFQQFTNEAPALIAIEMLVPARSTASRSVYVTSTDPDAQVGVDVSELDLAFDAQGQPILPTPTTPEKAAGLEARVVLNPDIENPDIENPDIENPDIENPDIENAEVYNPDIENPDIENPDIENPDIENPDIENPDIENPDIENPDIENVRVANPDIENPDIENPDIENPDIENPDIENPDIENGAIADITWKVTNTGNTTAAFNINVFLAQQNLGQDVVSVQLLLFKTYRTPAAQVASCELGFQTRNVLVANIANPAFIGPGSAGVPDQNDPSDKNASMWLGPGEEGRITLRVIDNDPDDNVLIPVTRPDGSTKLVSIDPAFAPTTSSTPTISSQGVGTEEAAGGAEDPPLVTPTGANLFFLQMPTNSVAGSLIAPPVQVQVRDNLTGTPVAGAIATLDFGSNPSEAALTGNVSAPTGVDGIATFPALTVSAVGNGYTLVASATTAGVTAQALSTPFDVGSAPAPDACVAAPAGLVGWWPGDGNASDRAGTNNGTMQGGATFAAGMVGQAFRFDGASGYVNFAGPSLTATTNWTMQAWINPASLNQFGIAVSNGYDNGAIGDGYAFGMGNVVGGTTNWRSGDLQGVHGGVDWLHTGYTFPTAGQWYHVVMLNESGVTKFFVNGVLVETTFAIGANVPTAFSIGAQPLADNGGIKRFFNGLVDEVGIFNRALSTTEIQQIFNAGSAGMCQGAGGASLVSRWSFDGNTNDAVGSNSAIATSGITYVQGRIGSGVSFGPGGFVDIADAPSLDLQRLTFSGWVKPAGPNTNPDDLGDIIINKARDLGDRAGAFLSWRAADGRFIFGLGGAPSTQSPGMANIFVDTALLASDQGFPAGQFHHVAATYDGATMRLYVNGLPQGVLAYMTTIPYNADPRSIGSNPPRFRGIGYDRTWKGVIDDLRVYGRPLTAAEVLALYNAALNVPGTSGGTENFNVPGGPAAAGGTAPVSTGLSLNVGDEVTISATGTVTYTFGGPLVSPDGIGPTTAADYGLAPPPVSGTSLIAQIGSGPWQFVGAGPTTLTASVPGLLRLAVNDSWYSDNGGAFNVTVALGGLPPQSQFVPGTAGGTVATSGSGTPPVNAGTLALGEQVVVTAIGSVNYGPSVVGPDGYGTTCNAGCLVNGVSAIALVARIGGGPWQLVGSGPTVLTATSAGLLEFGVNDDFFNDNTGGFVVKVSPAGGG